MQGPPYWPSATASMSLGQPASSFECWDEVLEVQATGHQEHGALASPAAAVRKARQGGAAGDGTS